MIAASPRAVPWTAAFNSSHDPHRSRSIGIRTFAQQCKRAARFGASPYRLCRGCAIAGSARLERHRVAAHAKRPAIGVTAAVDIRIITLMPVDRRTVDLSPYPDLVVIYLGIRVNAWRGLKTVLGLGPQIQKSWKA